MAAMNYVNPLGTEKVYARAEEKFLKTQIIYSNKNVDEYHVYWDEELTKPIVKDELVDLFLKGVCVFEMSRGMFIKPVACTAHEDDDAASITAVYMLNGDPYTVYSIEYAGNPV